MPSTNDPNVNSDNIVVDTENIDDVTEILFYEREDVFSEADFSFYEEPSDNEIKDILTSIYDGILGMPYQFPPIVDSRLTDDELSFGRKFMQKIGSVMPVMFITPGEPMFMAGYTDNEKKAILNLYDGVDGIDPNDVLSGSSAPYYSFNSRWPEFRKYVNTFVRALANFMGISDECYLLGQKKTFFDFEINDVLNDEFKKFFNADSCLALFLDAETSISESFGNSTTESILSQKINQLSDTAKEIEFLAGAANAGAMYDAVQSASGSLAGGIGEIGSNIPLAGGTINRITSALSTVVSGGKIAFPEIWSSSDYSRSYQINMKLRTPDPDPVSIMLNIYVPLCCLTALAMPRQIGHDANSYLSPFLVRATYKSIFNCELGIISSLNITKGGEDKWNAIGMPTSVDVDITIKDLYSTMFMSKSHGGLLNNTAQLDYIALMAGIDMNKDWITRNAKLRLLLTGAEVLTAIPSAWANLKFGANKLASNFLSKIVGSNWYT